MANDNQWIEEAALAELLGVPRVFLKNFRAELPPEAVEAVPGKAVLLKKNAARNALVAFGLTFQWEEEIPPLPQEPRAKERLTVVRCPPNRFIVTCRRTTGELVNVRVVDNRKYVPARSNGKPMTLEAIRNPMGTWWNLVGREPRWRGIW